MNFKKLRNCLTVATALLLGGSAAMAATAVNSGDASLSALEIRVDGKNLVNFDRNTTTYNIEVEDITMMTLSAAPAASDATVSITVNGRAYDNHSLASLDGGDNTIVYNIVSGGATKSYTVNIKTPQIVRGRHFDWKNATIYFVLTDRFYNGDTSNDKSYHRQRPQGNVPDYATFHGGDIKGLTEKLDYLDKLGVDAIWITAPYEQMHGWTGGKDDAFPHYAFHGYYALDWTYMDRNMGTVEEFRAFVTEAHRRGIRVVMDIVLNHTGYCTLDDGVDYDFGNFNGTPTAGWLPSGNQYTMWSSSNAVSFNADSQGKWGNWWSGWVRAFGDRSWGTGAGFTVPGGDDRTMSLAGLPDVVTEKTSPVNIPPFLKKKWQQENSGDYLNYRLPNLDQWRADGKGAPADYIINWLAGWVEEFGIDGFRCDTAKHVELNRWNQLKQACKQALNNWRSSSRADEYAKGWTTDFWMTGEAFSWDHGDTGYFTQGGFDSMINFAFNGTEGSQGRTPSTDDWRYYANYCNGSNGKQVLNYVSSHDTGLHRPGDQKKVATMLLLCPGGAQIYYGDETSRGYMSGCNDASMATRSDFNWSAVDNDDNKHWQKIGQFRRRNPAVGAGTQTELGDNTFARTYNQGDFSNAVVIKLNTSAGQTYTVNVGSTFADGEKVMDGYNTATTATVSGGKVSMAASGPVLLIEPYGQISDDVIVIPPTPQKPVVTANPATGTQFENSVTVTLTCNQGAPIHYTTTGTATASSPVYASPLTFTETTTLSTFVSNENGSNTQSFTYTLKQGGGGNDDDDKYYVYFDNTSNWNVKVWAWNDTESCTVSGSWPGDGMTQKDGKLYWEAPAGKVPTQIIFSNNGGEKAGGGDLKFVNKATYKPDGTYTTGGDDPIPPVPGARTIHFKGGWSATPYAYVYSESGATSIEYSGAWPGAQMTSEGNGWYSYALPDGASSSAMVIFNTGANGSERYPADMEPGIKLSFSGNEGWYSLSNHSWSSSNPDGPQKPSITVTPASGKVKGSSVITVSIANEATSISGTFNGKALSLSNGSNNVSVSSYLNDGQSGTMTISATNSLGTTEFNASFTRDDSTPVVTLTGDSRELSIYQIMVGSFQHGEGGASGYSDMWGPAGHRKNGNLRGIINALDYIKELGMNAIWMTPVFDSSNGGNGDEKLKATGYFANNYFKIDPHFGTDAEFRELVDKAHEKGMYIILDGVFGHHSNCTGASPKGKYIDNRQADNVRGTDAGNIAFPGSLDYFKEVVRYWMDEYGVDGWRLDQCYQVYQNGHNYWKELREEVEAVARERKNRGEQWGTLGFMVGEDWTSAGNITVTQQDGLKSVMDFDGKDNLVNLGYGVGSIEWLLKTDAAGRGYRDSGVNPTLFLSNHDTSRVGDFVSSTEGLMTRHAAVACYSGPTCTYYGDEIGDKSGNGNPDNKARTSGRISGFNSNEQRLHDYVAKVFKARAENPAMWRGTTTTRKDNESNCQVVEITKTDSQTGNKVVVVFSQKDTNWSIGGSGLDLINGGNVSGTINVKAWVPAVIKMN